MPAIHKSVATLRIMGDGLDPEEITRLLGHAPSAAQKKGDVSRSKSGRERIARIGMWRLETKDCEPSDPDAQVEEIIAKISGDLGVWRTIGSKFKSDMFFGLFMDEWNEGLSLSPASLVALGSRGISVDFDIYGPTKEDSPNQAPLPTPVSVTPAAGAPVAPATGAAEL